MSELLDATTLESIVGADGSIFLPEDSGDTTETLAISHKPTDEEIEKARQDLQNLFMGTPEEVARAEKMYIEGRREIGKGTEAEAFYVKCESLADVANRAYDRPTR